MLIRSAKSSECLCRAAARRAPEARAALAAIAACAVACHAACCSAAHALCPVRTSSNADGAVLAADARDASSAGEVAKARARGGKSAARVDAQISTTASSASASASEGRAQGRTLSGGKKYHCPSRRRQRPMKQQALSGWSGITKRHTSSSVRTKATTGPSMWSNEWDGVKETYTEMYVAAMLSFMYA